MLRQLSFILICALWTGYALAVNLLVQTVTRTGRKAALNSLGALASENGVTLIVVGLPLSMDGSDQASSEDARQIARSLRGRTGLEVRVWDERLTTVQAERALIEGGVRRNKRKKIVDQVAAAVMLQSFLDSRPPGSQGRPMSGEG